MPMVTSTPPEPVGANPNRGAALRKEVGTINEFLVVMLLLLILLREVK